jgi:hypothetical protein
VATWVYLSLIHGGAGAACGEAGAGVACGEEVAGAAYGEEAAEAACGGAGAAWDGRSANGVRSQNSNPVSDSYRVFRTPMVVRRRVVRRRVVRGRVVRRLVVRRRVVRRLGVIALQIESDLKFPIQ